MTRKEFAAQSGISVSTLDYYVRRERKAASPSGFTPNRREEGMAAGGGAETGSGFAGIFGSSPVAVMLGVAVRASGLQVQGPV